MDTAAIELSGLEKSFKPPRSETVHAVRGIDLTVPRGQILAFLGPNGAGKTTTLDMVLGLTDPTGGSVTVGGLPPRKAVAAGNVSAVLQSGGLLRDLTVQETVTVIASMFPHARPVEEVIDQAGLRPLAKRKVSKCSGGEQQRLRFALALLPDPDLLILDEPTAGMDVSARRDFWATMHADAASGRTVVFATHYLEEADDFAERIVMVAGGKVVADGTTEEIRAMASGRTVGIDLATDRVDQEAARLRDLEGVKEVEQSGNRLTITAADSDAVARFVLNELGGTNLEVTTASLDNAFMAITGESVSPTEEPGESDDTTGAVR
ncbi:ATP-binding cassette domain-containing protein [Dermacoccaceae bacterium W4C1]